MDLASIPTQRSGDDVTAHSWWNSFGLQHNTEVIKTKPRQSVSLGLGDTSPYTYRVSMYVQGPIYVCPSACQNSVAFVVNVWSWKVTLPAFIWLVAMVTLTTGQVSSGYMILPLDLMWAMYFCKKNKIKRHGLRSFACNKRGTINNISPKYTYKYVPVLSSASNVPCLFTLRLSHSILHKVM